MSRSKPFSNKDRQVHSQKIGARHERAVRNLLQSFGYESDRRKPIFSTIHGNKIRPDFWFPRGNGKRPILIECKIWGISGHSRKRPANSKSRKLQESLYELIQARRYCKETKNAILLLIIGTKNRFRPEEENFLTAELNPNFHILSIADKSGIGRIIK
jgi:hypothetical protein